MIWFGADPGGKNNFGVAVLLDDGTYKTECVSFVEQAIDWIREHDHIDGVGIDAPLWWSSGPSGDRKADNELRKYGPVQAPNSLRGAVLVQGVMLATRLRQLYPQISITEAHPKALLRFYDLSLDPDKWSEVQKCFGLTSPARISEHERDAVLAAVAARNGVTGQWPRDLSLERHETELDPKKDMRFGQVSYFWPDKAA